MVDFSFPVQDFSDSSSADEFVSHIEQDSCEHVESENNKKAKRLNSKKSNEILI